MKLQLRQLLFAVLFVILSRDISAQIMEYSYYGNSVTPKGDLHTLIVFIGFDDATSGDDYPNWAHDDLPEWAKGDYNDVFDIDDSQILAKPKNILTLH